MKNWRGFSSYLTQMTAIATLCVMSTVALADKQGPGALGQPFELELTGYARFSDAETYTPPEELPTVTYEESEEMGADRRSKDMTAVAVTPAGDLFKAEVDPKDLEIFEDAMDFLSDAFQGTIPEDALIDDLGLSSNEASESVETFGLESVHPPDERVRVHATTRYPWRAIGRIDIGCTGTLIGPRHVLTAGHCVYDTSTDRWYRQLNFSPGQNGAHRPYGTIPWRMAITTTGWTRSHSINYDYAMIVLARPIGTTTGWLGFGYRNGSWRMNVNINGYPVDKPFGTMWHDFCRMETTSNYRVRHYCDTYNGMSGSGLYLYNTTGRIIYAVHTHGGASYNTGTRINRDVFSNLVRWKSQNP